MLSSLLLFPFTIAIKSGCFSSSVVLQDNMSSRVSCSFTIYYAILLVCSMKLVGSESATTPTFGNMTDRLALLAFKDGISVDPLRALSSWNDSLHFCDWQGVTCGRRHQRVTVLDLQSKRLVGTLAPSIGNLTFLKLINLGNNNFYGQVPSEFGRLFRLQNLNLSYNQFTGEIPVNLTHCSDLKVIDFNINKFTGEIPAKLGSLTKLVTLYLENNNLTGGIPPFGNLSSLSELSLARNNLEGNIPDDLGRISSLTFLHLASNKLSGTPPLSLYNLSLIYHFSIADNRLNGSLPPNIGLTLPNLQTLTVGINQLTGPIPFTLSNASGLSALDFVNNNFTGGVPVNLGSLKGLAWLNLGGNSLGSGDANNLGFLTSLANCTSLRVLNLNVNRFRGVLPNSVANLSTQLTWLTLGANEISGSIPTGIENLVNLNILGMEFNFLIGNIPVGIGKLRQLLRLFLNYNELSGLIPSSLGNITQLYELRLEENNLKGSIPSSLGDCHKLRILHLSQNNFDGTIPKQVIGLSSSIFLNLAHNSLTGSLPLEVGNLKQLGVLDISENQFSSEIPNTLGDCLGLEYLYLQSNFFQGIIPLSLRTLKGIQVLDLSRNNLSGRIPKYLQNFTSLRLLNLSFNDLEGEVPVEGVFKNASAFSVFGNNKLCGGILELQLPPCPIQVSKKQGKSLVFKLTVTITVGFLCLSLILIFATMRWERKSRKIPSSYSLKDSYVKVSYQELFDATGGFSSANLIGVGSFSSVYKGVLELADKRSIAVKVLNLQEKGASKSFTAECDALRNIRHRNLIKILTSCSSLDYKGNNFMALVFEFMPNGSLEKWLHRKVDGEGQSRILNFLHRLNIAIDVAFALDYLHHHCQTPIVHCDLKPSNVLLDDDMIAHVGDFGLARFLSENTNRFSKNQISSVGIRGSIGYIAPEYGMGGETSTHGDVYSYGILLLEMFTGKRPTDGLFSDGLSLLEFSKKALPGRLMEIVDPIILLEREGATNDIGHRNDGRDKLEECLASILGIAILCSTELPRERMMMKDVTRELHLIRDSFLGLGIHN